MVHRARPDRPRRAVLRARRGGHRGQQLRRGFEVTVGVAIGIAIGDLFRVWAGVGWWQVGVVVTVAMALALLAGAGQLMITQAGVQSIVVITVVGPNGAFNRWLDAVIGGMVALVLALAGAGAGGAVPGDGAAARARGCPAG